MGKVVFGIDHYWLRYEFADGRGQIHCHMLAISNDKHMQSKIHELKHKPDEQARVAAEWASKKFGLTASFDPNMVTVRDIDPVKIYNYEANDVVGDVEALKECVELHDCNPYCLRQSTKEDKEKYIALKGLKE